MLEKEVINFERTAIVGIVTQNQSEEKLNEYLDELEFLTYTAGGEVIKRFSQKMERPNPKTFMGTGKIEEINLFVKENDISTLIFDDELSPSQQKNISRIIDCKILDRTNLILDIFAQRAESSYARTQV
ncbi:GTPase HflX, partial [Flavobacterium sp. LBUM151]